MRITTTTLVMLINYSVWSQSLPMWAQEQYKGFADKYVLSDYMKPQFLEADLSGDSKPDVAILIERKVDKKKGVLILFSTLNKGFIVGAGDKFGNAGSDFDWAHTWNVFKEKTTVETTFKANGEVAGGRELKLERAAIQVTEEEGAGGLIYFDGKKLVWIHQGD